MIKGIDVSKHNGKIDWSKVKNDNVDFAIIRAGLGFSTVDDKFLYNITEAKKNGLKVGIYWFSYACSVQDAETEAKFVVNLLNKNKITLDLPIFWDFEYDSDNYCKKAGVNVTKSLFSDMYRAFCRVITASGNICGLYVNLDYLNRYTDESLKKSALIWYADWRGINYKPTAKNVLLWQYGAETNKIDSKTVSGINGVVDKDYLLNTEIFNNSETEEELIKKYDVDGDGSVTSQDALTILNYVVGNN